MQRVIYIILASISVLFGTVVVYKLASATRCPAYNFVVPQTAVAEQKVYFSDSTADAKTWFWDFGDLTEGSAVQNPSHTYTKAGKYIVKLIINGKCDDYKDITVEPKHMDDLEMAHIQGPTEARIGQSINFTELTENATAYEWLFSESGKVDAKTKSPSYVFQSTGYKTITVYVTSAKGRITGTLTVNVKDKDAVITAPVIKAPVDNTPKLSTQEKKNLFTNGFTTFVTSSDDATRQNAMEKFKPYICGPDAPVYKNGKEAVGIMIFCKDLQDKNKFCKVKSMNIDWNDGSDCLKAVHLEYKEK